MTRPFADVYDDHVWAVYGYLAYRTSSRHDAEDLTQHAFERALRAYHRFDPMRASERTWLLAIAGNLLIDHHRSARRRQTEELADDSAMAPPPALPRGALEPEVEAALGDLSVRAREVLALRFGADLTGAEIGELLDLSLANVQQILSRSLRQLRGVLSESGAERA
jgi:RNA polymerase sigma-70 factor (ECF subfamily)